MQWSGVNTSVEWSNVGNGSNGRTCLVKLGSKGGGNRVAINSGIKREGNEIDEGVHGECLLDGDARTCRAVLAGDAARNQYERISCGMEVIVGRE